MREVNELAKGFCRTVFDLWEVAEALGALILCQCLMGNFLLLCPGQTELFCLITSQTLASLKLYFNVLYCVLVLLLVLCFHSYPVFLFDQALLPCPYFQSLWWLSLALDRKHCFCDVICEVLPMHMHVKAHMCMCNCRHAPNGSYFLKP